MKLKSKLKLYEAFLTSKVNEATEATKPTTDSVAIDTVTVDSAEAVRIEVIRDVDTILNNLTELSDRIGESASINLEIDELYEELFELTNITELNEGILDFIKSPIKFMKIKKNLKMYQKALIQQAINDVDYAKKLQASNEDPDPKAKEVLKKSNEAKNQALKDQLSAVGERMTELSGGDEGLGKVVSIGKTKSKLAAAKVVMKATSGEEAKQLKLEISTLEDRISKDEKSLKDYAAKQEPKKEPEGESAADKSADQLNGPDKEKKEKKEKKTAGYDENVELDGSGRIAPIMEETEESVVTEEVEEVEEGNEFGAARAEAIAKGEKTFKVGDEEYPVEDVSKEDEENAEEFVEEAKIELPKTIKLDESMSIADRFKALM
jgi:hypothetical protein